jgi:hypothetical protein
LDADDRPPTSRILVPPLPSRAKASPLRGLALPQLGQRDPEIAPVAGRAHPTLRAVDRLDLCGREHEKLMGLAGLPTDTHPIPSPRPSPDTTDPAVRDADTVAQPYRSGHQSPVVFPSSAETSPPGGGTPLHTHHNEDEALSCWRASTKSSVGMRRCAPDRDRLFLLSSHDLLRCPHGAGAVHGCQTVCRAVQSPPGLEPCRA